MLQCKKQNADALFKAVWGIELLAVFMPEEGIEVMTK